MERRRFQDRKQLVDGSFQEDNPQRTGHPRSAAPANVPQQLGRLVLLSSTKCLKGWEQSTEKGEKAVLVFL